MKYDVLYSIITCTEFAIVIYCYSNIEPWNSFGGVAHLGERLNGIQEVVGSIPIVSTNKKALKILFFNAFCRIRARLFFWQIGLNLKGVF